jgi:hypothetical protein
MPQHDFDILWSEHVKIGKILPSQDAEGFWMYNGRRHELYRSAVDEDDFVLQALVAPSGMPEFIPEPPAQQENPETKAFRLLREAKERKERRELQGQ